jgi:hypothetical protein
MAKLIIGNDFINFTADGNQYSGQLARVILEDRVVYTVYYFSTDGDINGKCQMTAIKDECNDRYIWACDTPGLSDSFIIAVGTEIEKQPSWMENEKQGK